MNFTTLYPHIKSEKIDFLLIDAGKWWFNTGKGRYGNFRDLTGAALRSLHQGSIVIFCDFNNWVMMDN